MIATLKIDLSESLSPDEFRELTQAALEENKPLDRVIYDAVRDLRNRRRMAKQSTSEEVAA